jgi:predicted peptidase
VNLKMGEAMGQMRGLELSGNDHSRLRRRKFLPVSHCFILLATLLFIPFSTLPAQQLDTLKGVSTVAGSRIPFTVLATRQAHEDLPPQHPDHILEQKPQKTPIAIPAILFLHGAGERGDNNSAQLTVGLPQFIKSLDSLGIQHYLIVVPQCPLDKRWVETDWTLPSHAMEAQLSPTLANALHIFDSVIASNPAVDTNCLYATGLSMGGFGVWELIQRHPDKFAAALPICGGGDTAQAAQLTHIPIWAFHGKKDRLVKPSRTTDMITAIQKQGGNPKVTLYETIGHLCWNTVYKDLDVIRWLFSQHRNEG